MYRKIGTLQWKESMNCLIKTKNTPNKQTNLFSFEGFVEGVCLPLNNFSFIWRRHHYRWSAAISDSCLALMDIEQWEFFNVPHRASVCNGHHRGPLTLTCCQAIGSGMITACFYDLALSRLGFEQPIFRMRVERSNRLRHRGNEYGIKCMSDSLVYFGMK